MDWLDFVKVMMVDERAAQAKYRMAVDLATDPTIKAIFQQLADEEAEHVKFLETKQESIAKLLGK